MNENFTNNPNCGIISDLLPLYHDGIASQSSKIYVETHLKCCPECREKYEDMKQELPIAKTDDFSTKKLFKKALHHRILQRITVCVLSLVLAFTVIIGLWFVGDTLVWSEAENGEDAVPEYVYAYADIMEKQELGDGWVISAEENFAMRQYAEIGLMKIWDLKGNLIYEGYKQDEGTYSDMPDSSPETLKDIFTK